MSRRRNIHPYLSDELYERFKKFAAATDATESSIVEVALSEYLDQTSHRRLVLKRLNKLGRNIDRVERDLAIVLETVGAFLNIWMVHNPKLPESREDIQRKAAAPRIAAMQKYVAQQVSGSRRFFNDVVKDVPLAQEDNDTETGSA